MQNAVKLTNRGTELLNSSFVQTKDMTVITEDSPRFNRIDDSIRPLTSVYPFSHSSDLMKISLSFSHFP